VKDIVDITVAQARIFPADSLPLTELRAPTNAALLKDAFKFGAVQGDPFGLQLSFTNGTFEHRGKPINVLSLIFEQRKMSIQIRGRSPAADAFYSAVARVLQSIGGQPRTSRLEPLVKADETSCVVTMEIHFEDLVAPTLWQFIQKEAKHKLRVDRVKARSITFKNLSFEVKYEIDPLLAEHDISLTSKLLTIEPRTGTPSNERRYFTSSPTDSETHLEILEGIERETLKLRNKKTK
jgi:hypothetical protein